MLSLVHKVMHCNMCSVQELSGDIANFGSQKEQRTKAAQAKLKAAKTGLEGRKKAAKEASQKLTLAAAEAEAASSERQSLTEQLQTAQKTVQGTASSVLSDLQVVQNLVNTWACCNLQSSIPQSSHRDCWCAMVSWVAKACM